MWTARPNHHIRPPPLGPSTTVAVHLITIPCEPNTATTHIENRICCENRPCRNNFLYAKFEVFRTVLCDFVSIFRVFVCQELWVNLPVATFFGMVDYN